MRRVVWYSLATVIFAAWTAALILLAVALWIAL